MPLTLAVNIQINAQHTSVLDLGIATFPVIKNITKQFANGTGVNQASKMFSDTRSLAASASEDLDLAGVLTDAFGATFTLTKINGILVSTPSSNPSTITLGNVTNGIVAWFGAATQSLTIRPGGTFLLYAPDSTGYTVTAATADLLHVVAGAGGTHNYDIVVWGS